MLRAVLFCLCCVLVTPAAGQVKSGSYWPLINPDVWAQRLLQFAIVSARTQADIQYQHLSTNVAAGTVSLSGVELWPSSDWVSNYECYINVARLSVSGVPIEEVESLSLTASAFGVVVSTECLPPEFKPVGLMLKAAGIDALVVPKIRVDLKYHVPDGSLLIDASFNVHDMLSMAANIDLSYVTVDLRALSEPHPVVFLRGATLRLEDQGLWSMVLPVLPAAMKDPEKIRSQMIPRLAEEIFADINGASKLSKEQQSFVDSVGESLSDFVVNPGRLVLEVLPKEEVAISADDVDGIDALFESLAPRMARQSVVAENTVPLSDLEQVIAGRYFELSDNELSIVARAVVTGVGAPRNLEVGRLVALELASRGAVTSALAAAELFQDRDPVMAYELAVSAARSGSHEAAGLADRLESKLSLSTVLETQSKLNKPLSQMDFDADDVQRMGDRAFSRFVGTGATRSYELAAFWAILASAVGDPRGRAVLDEIEAMVSVRTDADRATWVAWMRQAELDASDLWLQKNIPELIKGK